MNVDIYDAELFEREEKRPVTPKQKKNKKAALETFPVKALLDAKGRLVGVEVFTLHAGGSKNGVDPGELLYPNEARALRAKARRRGETFVTTTWVFGKPIKLLRWAK